MMEGKIRQNEKEGLEKILCLGRDPVYFDFQEIVKYVYGVNREVFSKIKECFTGIKEKYKEEIERLQDEIAPLLKSAGLRRSNSEKVSLCELETFHIMAQEHFNGDYKATYKLLIKIFDLFGGNSYLTKIKPHKLFERLKRRKDDLDSIYQIQRKRKQLGKEV